MQCPHCHKEIPLSHVYAETGKMGGKSGTGIAKRRSDEHYVKMREKHNERKAKAKAFRETLGLST
jgi:hypothetical protein